MEPEQTPAALQRKLYFLLEKLQEYARELPSQYQMRVSIELLSGLANCLLNDTVFEIVKGLMEIQHVTEKHLFQQRLQVISNHTAEIQHMINTTPEDQQDTQKNILLPRHKEELRQTDMKLVFQLDQKVSDQQLTLEQAGVPGFFVTNKPLEIKARCTSYKVHDIMNDNFSAEVNNEAMQLSLQLLHEKPVFTVLGLFDLNYALLQQGARSVSTYLVVLLQFATGDGQGTPTI